PQFGGQLGGGGGTAAAQQVEQLHAHRVRETAQRAGVETVELRLGGFRGFGHGTTVAMQRSACKDFFAWKSLHPILCSGSLQLAPCSRVLHTRVLHTRVLRTRARLPGRSSDRTMNWR